MAERTSTAPWLDLARSGQDPELRELVKLWAVGYRPILDEPIERDLAPLPKAPPDTARLMLRDALNAATAKARPEFYGDGPRLQMRVYFQERLVGRADVGEAWGQFVGELMSPAPLGFVACARCGRSFAPLRATATYCSVSCRTLAHRARKGGEPS